MLIYPFFSCNGRLESKKVFVISGRTRMYFFLGERAIRSVYVCSQVAAIAPSFTHRIHPYYCKKYIDQWSSRTINHDGTFNNTKFGIKENYILSSVCIHKWTYKYTCYGNFYKPRKARFIPTFCKRINRNSTAVGNWWSFWRKEDERLLVQQKFIYNNNNNKQSFTPHGTNNELEEFRKEFKVPIVVGFCKVCKVYL